LAVDLDGTVLGYDGTVSPRVMEALQAARGAGVVVMLATGRMAVSARRYWERLGLSPGPAICYQGAEVVDMPGGTLWFRDTLPDEGARLMAEQAVHEGFLCQVYIGEELWVSREDERVRRYMSTNRIPALVRGLPDLTAWPEPPVKLLIQGEPSDLARLRALLEPDAERLRMRLVMSQRDFLEIVPEDVGKGRALARVAERLGIAQSAVAAAGDGENDADMLAWAGLGIAMGQAHAAAIAAADVVAPPVEQDGLAQAIFRYILQEEARGEPDGH
jgi:Cof subfamily protein (haloacid dehalogenase superfamily)